MRPTRFFAIKVDVSVDTRRSRGLSLRKARRRTNTQRCCPGNRDYAVRSEGSETCYHVYNLPSQRIHVVD
jgi:hypothetical protein